MGQFWGASKLSVLCRATGRPRIPIPEPLFARLVGRFGLSRLPRAAVEHLKYPNVIDDAAFRAATGFEPAFDEVETMAAFRRALCERSD